MPYPSPLTVARRICVELLKRAPLFYPRAVIKTSFERPNNRKDRFFPEKTLYKTFS